MPQQK